MLTYCAAHRAGYSLIRVSLQSIAYFQKFVKTVLRFSRELLNVVFVAKHIQRMYAVCFRGMCKLRPVICLQNVRSVTEEFNCPFEKVHCGEAALRFIRVDKSIPRRFFYDGILIEFPPVFSGITSTWHVFHIHLPLFAEDCRCIVFAGMLGFFLCGFRFLPEPEADEYAV